LENELKNIKKSLKDAEQKLSKMEPHYEDLISWKVAENARKQLIAWIAMWTAAITAGICIAGWTTYNEIKTSVVNLVKTQYSKVADQAVLEGKMKMDSELARVVSDAETDFTNRLKEIGNSIPIENRTQPVIEAFRKATQVALQKVETGYAYVGNRIASGWSETHFENTVRSKINDIPQKGDILKVKDPVNIRSGVIQYIEEKGWVNKPTKGYLKSGQKVEVLGVDFVADNYIWINFKTVN